MNTDHRPGATPGYPSPGTCTHGPSSLARALLAQVGVEVSEPLACGLGGGIGFFYTVFTYADAPVPLLTIVAQHHPQPWLDAVAAHLDLHLTTVTASGPARGLLAVDAALREGRAAQIVVGRGHLPWHPDVRPEEAADPHPIVVAGRSTDGYLVDDGARELHVLSPDGLADAWAAHRKGRFAVTTVDRPASDPDLAAGVRAAITTTYAHLTGPVLHHAFDVNVGLSGLHRLAADLADTRTARGWTRRFVGPLAVATASRRLAECLTTAHTSEGATRPLYAAFLDEAGPLSGLPLRDASATAADAGRRWRRLADLARAATPEDDARAVFASYAAVVAELVPVEEHLAAQLGSASGAVPVS